MGMEKTTTDHDEIKQWAQRFEGKPQVIESPEAGAEKPALRISFPGEKGEISFGHARSIRDSNWTEFFRIFEDLELAIVYLPEPNPNNLADSYKFVSREQV
jgi:hypothetical protein